MSESRPVFDRNTVRLIPGIRNAEIVAVLSYIKSTWPDEVRAGHDEMNARYAIRGEQTLVELSQQFDVHANQIKQWKDQLLEGATGVFGDETKAEPSGPTIDVKTLHAKIGELTLENDFLSGALGKAGLLGGKK